MRILVIGGIHFPLGEELACRLAASQGVNEVCVWSLEHIRGAHRLEAAGVRVLDNRAIPHTPGGTRGVLKLARARQSLHHLRSERFDVVSAHFLEPQLAALVDGFRRLAPRLVASFWGSELWLPGQIGQRIQHRLTHAADAITVPRSELRTSVGERFGLHAKAKTRVIPIGLSPLEPLNISDQVALRRATLGLPEEGPIVAVGYNGVPGQQHAAILKRLEAASLPDQTTVVMPLTFGGRPDYHQTVRDAARKSALNCIVLDQYMPNEHVATLRKVTDVFIQLQPTKVLPGSLLEHVYAGSTTITGDWVNCDMLNGTDAPLIRVADLDAVGDRCREALANRSQQRPTSNATQRVIWEQRSWETNLPKWLELLAG